MTKNASLALAAKNKHDEFYTDMSDIIREVEEYVANDPDIFRNKSVLLPCDDPQVSHFTRYFIKNFKRLGLKLLVSTCYNPDGRGKFFMKSDDSDIDLAAIPYTFLEGDGSFLSQEVTEIRDNVDFVITNPPFSLFREFVQWCEEGSVKYSVIGTINAVTYKDIFRLIQSNKLRLGATSSTTNMAFRVPNKPEYVDKKIVEKKGKGYVAKLGNILWFTTIEHNKYPKPMFLDTLASNKKFNSRIRNNDKAFKVYDNYDALEVPSTLAIPSDYDGEMGVPISFITSYCPEQFTLLGHGKPSLDGKFTYERLFIRHKNSFEGNVHI